MLRFLGIVCTLIIILAPGQAHAVCGSPAGNPGDVVYNQTEKIFQYCADDEWKRMNIKPGAGAGGCTSPTVAEGQMAYNTDQRVLQGCAGNEHRPFGPVAGGVKWKNISVGSSHTCGVRTGGTLWCWGSDSAGQLGNGATTGNQDIPVQESTNATNWTQVSSASGHSCAVKTDGSLWCWGANSYGKLGNGLTTGNQDSPGRESTNATNWAQVSTGGNHTCAIKTDGSLWCWGRDNVGQLGNGGAITADQTAPSREATSATDWAYVSAGASHTCAVKTTGTLWCWGIDSFGALGDGVGVVNQNAPVQESTLATDWAQVSTGLAYTTCAVKTSGTLWCWGSGSSGDLGDGTSTFSAYSPVQESSAATNWLQVNTGYSHSCAVKSDGSLWCWGNDTFGQLGNGATTGNQLSPFQESSGATDWALVTTGNSHSCALKTNGSLWCWGYDTGGMLGNGSTLRTSPVQESSQAVNWMPVNGGSYRCAIKTDGSLWCWGSDGNGQLGNGATTGSQISPVREITNATDWLQASGGASHTCAVKNNGTLWCWGNDGNGQLGNGAATGDQDSPVQESTNATDWVHISARGGSHSCAIKTNGTLWCWGRDANGQLGNGAIAGDQVSPSQESTNATDWAQVSTALSHTCAVKTGGSLWCWGRDHFGQLGNGATATDQVSPARESTNATDWVQVSAANLHTCAIKTDKSLWCWGNDANGQLGNGATAGNQVSPVRESTNATDWAIVDTNGSVTCAIKTDGSLWCWGSGSSGALGNGTTSDQISPTREITNATDWAQVTTGNGQTCAIKTNGTLWCWGSNNGGALGAGIPLPESPLPSNVCARNGNKEYRSGDILYNTDHKIVQYCDGVGWVGVGIGLSP